MNYDDFLHPAKTFREVPFWSWNDDLDPDELRRQIALMDEGGWGGFFMHARLGLRTPYLGQRWMECVRACIDEATQRHMGAWLYDEDKWPSGFAGGLAVTDPAHHAQALVCLIDNKPALLKDHVAAFVARRSGGRLSAIRPLDELAAFNGDEESLVQFHIVRGPFGDPNFNGYTYLNVLDPAAVRAFLDSTYEPYWQLFGERFGGTVPGVFTDEPAYLNTAIIGIGVTTPGETQAVPWVHDLPAAFRTRWGYDLLPHLPALFVDVGAFPRVRYHFWRLVTERFVQAFSKQIYDWCDERGLALTGHYLLEDDMWVQTRWIGAAMPHYQYEHIPGIDKLGRHLFTPLTVKQLDSAVCQLGRPRALCESYGAAGQDFSFAGRKWIGDWLYVLGVNLNNPHLSHYSLRGERKRDHPPYIFYQQPWWPENRLIADYFGRLSYALSQGRRVVDILVLHPIGSTWSRYRSDGTGAAGKLDDALSTLEHTLLNVQRDYHYGDELLMEQLAAVVKEKDAPRLEIGRMRYQVVIVPPSYTWTQCTSQLLHEFAAAGGMVLALPPLPHEIEGVDAEHVLPRSTRVVELVDLPRVLDDCLPFDVRVIGCPSVWYHHRRDADIDWYFLCNTSLEQHYRATVELRGSGRLEAWDPVTGAKRHVATQTGDMTRVALEFPPIGSHLLMLQREPVSDAQVVRVQTFAPRAELTLGDSWRLELNEPNVLTLDRASVQIAGRAWSAPLYILDAHQKVKFAGEGTAFTLQYTVDVIDTPEGPLFLVVEAPERYEIRVNGQPVAIDDQGWWCDISFRKVNISGTLCAGANMIELHGVFDREMEIESVYLVGAFGVTAKGGTFEGECQGQQFFRYGDEFRITKLAERLDGGDLAGQGFPFFAGRLRLSQQVRLNQVSTGARLMLDGVHAAVVRVFVNGAEAGIRAWPPYEVELSTWLNEGDNKIAVELVSTLRNLLGPHHLRGGDPEGVGPHSYRPNPHWTDDYVLGPFGLGKVRLLT